MSSYGSIEYAVVTGTVAAIATFNTAVEAKVNLGYAPVNAAFTDSTGTNIAQLFMKGSASSFTANYPIAIAPTVGAAGSGVFTVAGDIAKDFRAGYRFSVTGSTANDGVYTVKAGSAVFSNPNTTIPVVEAVGSAVVDGQIIAYSPY